MKYYLNIMMVLLILTMGACNDKEAIEKDENNEEVTPDEVNDENKEEQEENDASESNNETTENNENISKEENNNEFNQEFNEEIYDSDDIRIVLKEIKRQEGGIMNKGYYIALEVENKLAKDVVVFSTNESADDKMIDSMASLSAPVKGNSVELIEMSIKSFDKDLLFIQEKLEFTVSLSDEDFDVIGEHPVIIDFTPVAINGNQEENEGKEDNSGLNEEKENGDFERNYNDVIYDSEQIKVTLKRIKKETVRDVREKQTYYINLEIENKLDKNISFWSEKTIADGKSIDKYIAFIDKVVANKTVDAVMKVQDFSDDPLPIIEDYIESEIVVVDEESSQRIGVHTIKFDFQ
ncbi:hypothetical protein [Ornithinibacillus halotolerans]|uniref:Uncharacterized protein n=1 Tax=Ornithinibacillus halotolerans TaxID=1274357 RepID=A0A916RLE3_9BACI|nr:hypothetical protein [Ornithinibacillus halotolerans]GGA60623.1 hypothetical protein GCM10008025_00820 [Ornithinibacillus halotolerans]